MLMECALLQEGRDEYYTADSLSTSFETIPETYIVEFLWEAWSFWIEWSNILYNSLHESSPNWCSFSNFYEPPDLDNIIRLD